MKRNNVEINIYSLERMLIELMRFRSKLPLIIIKRLFRTIEIKQKQWILLC